MSVVVVLMKFLNFADPAITAPAISSNRFIINIIITEFEMF